MKKIIHKKDLKFRLKVCADDGFVGRDEYKFLLHVIENFESIERDAKRYRRFKEIAYTEKNGLSGIELFNAEELDELLDRPRKKVV